MLQIRVYVRVSDCLSSEVFQEVLQMKNAKIFWRSCEVRCNGTHNICECGHIWRRINEFLHRRLSAHGRPPPLGHVAEF
jgi:hypothetical protein